MSTEAKRTAVTRSAVEVVGALLVVGALFVVHLAAGLGALGALLVLAANFGGRR